MIEIIPAILTDSEEEFVRLVHMLERVGVKRVHLDICDGIFVPARTITGYDQLLRLKTALQFDVHLMVESPESRCEDWCAIPQADRFFIHIEATPHFNVLCERAAKCHKKIGAVIEPDMSTEKLESVTAVTDLVQFMMVHPGAQGRVFLTEVLENMRVFHSAHPDISIIADGGINPATAPQCVAAGASALVAGSYITKSIDLPSALAELQKSIS